MILLVTGGSGCGKSAYAEKRVMELAAPGRETIYYLATMQVYGEEGRKKVERHHALRLGKGMQTIEQPRDVAEVIPKLSGSACTVLLEDLGNLVANEMFLMAEDGTPKEVPWQRAADKIISQLTKLEKCVSNLVLVTNNVFEDGICYEESTQNYIRALGRVNEALAGRATEAVEVVVGIPLSLKNGK